MVSLDELFNGRTPNASEVRGWAELQGFTASQNATGPLKFLDANNITRVTIKQGSARTAGSENPHVELRNNCGDRIDPFGNPVSKRSPGNHTPINWDF